MKYAHSIDQSAEFLRQALPLMSKQATGLHPVSYAVWYEYVAGENPSLRASIDTRLGEGAVLDEQTTLDLYKAHVADLDEAARSLSIGFQKILADMAHSATQANDDAARFDRVLETCSADLAAPGIDARLGAAVDLLLQHTRSMQSSVAFLRGRLDQSRLEIESLRQEVSRARQDARADSLTGLMNRRGFDDAMATCLSDPAAPDTTCLLIADIDFFKRINDRHGHLFGDKVIQTVARVLKNTLKRSDVIARYGGEEFIVLLPETPLSGACQLAEKIRGKVEGCRIKRLDNNHTISRITISIGVASYRRGESPNEFIARADRALYASKEQGRNRVTVADASPLDG